MSQGNGAVRGRRWTSKYVAIRNECLVLESARDELGFNSDDDVLDDVFVECCALVVKSDSRDIVIAINPSSIRLHLCANKRIRASFEPSRNVSAWQQRGNKKRPNRNERDAFDAYRLR